MHASNEVSVYPKIRAQLTPGTEVTLELPGGGGYGPPEERDPALVLEDVRNGYVSLKRARDDYRVVIDAETMLLNDAETHQLRQA